MYGNVHYKKLFLLATNFMKIFTWNRDFTHFHRPNNGNTGGNIICFFCTCTDAFLPSNNMKVILMNDFRFETTEMNF